MLEVITEADKHLSAKEIYERVSKRIPGVAYSTVYNALNYLRKAGLIKEVRTPGRGLLYDKRCERHDHLICRACGKVLDYHLNLLDPVLGQIELETGFKIETATTSLEGFCPDCRARCSSEDSCEGGFSKF